MSISIDLCPFMSVYDGCCLDLVENCQSEFFVLVHGIWRLDLVRYFSIRVFVSVYAVSIWI